MRICGSGRDGGYSAAVLDAGLYQAGVLGSHSCRNGVRGEEGDSGGRGWDGSKSDWEGAIGGQTRCVVSVVKNHGQYNGR
jgi:hypothetical protein